MNCQGEKNLHYVYNHLWAVKEETKWREDVFQFSRESSKGIFEYTKKNI